MVFTYFFDNRSIYSMEATSEDVNNNGVQAIKNAKLRGLLDAQRAYDEECAREKSLLLQRKDYLAKKRSELIQERSSLRAALQRVDIPGERQECLDKIWSLEEELNAIEGELKRVEQDVALHDAFDGQKLPEVAKHFRNEEKERQKRAQNDPHYRARIRSKVQNCRISGPSKERRQREDEYGPGSSDDDGEDNWATPTHKMWNYNSDASDQKAMRNGYDDQEDYTPPLYVSQSHSNAHSADTIPQNDVEEDDYGWGINHINHYRSRNSNVQRRETIVRVPSDLPKFRGASEKGLDDPEEFLDIFIKTCTAHEFPQNWWIKALPLSLDRVDGKWLAKYIHGRGGYNNCTWSKVASSFLKHFQDPNAMQFWQEKIQKLRMTSSEGIQRYADQFIGLARKLRWRLDDPNAVYHFKKGLTRSILVQLSAAEAQWKLFSSAVGDGT